MYVLSAASALYLPGIAVFFSFHLKKVSQGPSSHYWLILWISSCSFLCISSTWSHAVCAPCAQLLCIQYESLLLLLHSFCDSQMLPYHVSLCHRHWTNPCCCVFSCHVWAVGSSMYLCMCLSLCVSERLWFICFVVSVWVFGCQYVYNMRRMYVRCVICSMCSAVGAVAAVIPAVAAAVVKTAAAAVWVFPSLCPHPLHPAPSQVTSSSQKAHLTT